MSDLGKRIKEARKAAKLTQEDLARILGLDSESAVSRYESNQRGVDIDKLALIAKTTNHSLNWLSTGEGEKEAKTLDSGSGDMGESKHPKPEPEEMSMSQKDMLIEYMANKIKELEAENAYLKRRKGSTNP